MDKRIAIITGASGGIGKEFVRELLKESIDEIWAIARNIEKLEALKIKFGDKVAPYSMDLTSMEDIRGLKKRLEEEKPNIKFLVNNAGVAKMGKYDEFSLKEIENTVMLNCNALVSVSSICIPYMKRGSHIINLSSASSFQPLPYLNLYASSKVFERYYSRALNRELKDQEITSTAVCPSWVETDLLKTEVNGRKINFHGKVKAERVVKQAIKDAKRGKDMSVCTLYIKYLHVLAKIFPQRITMNTWMRGIKKYL